MLRKFLLLLALLVIVGIVLVATGVVELSRPGEVRINPVEVGTETRQVQTPTVRVDRGNEAAPAAAPAPAPPPPPANGQ